MAIITLNNRATNRSDTASAGQVFTATSATAADFQAGGGGKILQVKSTAYPNLSQQTVTATSYTQIDGYVVTITPASTSSKIYVTGSVHFDSGGNGNNISLAIYRKIGSGSYASPINYATGYDQASASSRTNNVVPAWPYIDSPNTTSELTYAFFAKTSVNDTIYCNRKSCNITVMEIGA